MTASQITTQKMWKKFLLSNFLYKTTVRINYFFWGLGDLLLRSPSITDFLLALINFPKLCGVCMHLLLLKNQKKWKSFKDLFSTDIQRNNNGKSSFPLQRSCTKDWWDPELGQPCQEIQVHSWQPFQADLGTCSAPTPSYHLRVLLSDTTNSALLFAWECYLLTSSPWCHQHLLCLTKLRK